MKEIGNKRYGDSLQILPTGNLTDIYRYSDAMIKHMSKDALKTFGNTFIYSKQDVMLTGGCDRVTHNNDNLNLRGNNNLTQRLANFGNNVSL